MRRTFLLAAALALLGASPAAAKEITAAQVCGPAGCSDVDLAGGLHEFPGGGNSWNVPPQAEPFVEVRLTFDGGMHYETVWFVPGAGVFALPDGTGLVRWARPAEQRLDRLIADAAAAVEPHQPRVTAAYVDGKKVVGDVSGYITLFEAAPDTSARDLGEEFASISLTTTPPSPWERSRLWFYPEKGLLQRGNETVVLPRHVAAALRDGAPIGPAPTGTGFDGPLVTGSLLVAFALALTTVLLSRRSRPARPGTA